MGIVAAVPLKRLTGAKQRLAGCLADQARAELVLAMAADVLAALQQSAAVDAVWLVSDDEQAAPLAAMHGAIWRRERELGGGAGLNAVATTIAATSAREGYAGLLLAHADLPFLQAADVAGLVAAWVRQPEGKRMALAPAHDGGTNLLLCSPDPRLQFQYGPASASRHQLAGLLAGYSVAVQQLDGAAWDIDTPADLQRLQGALEAGWQSSRTAQFLRDSEVVRKA